MRAIAVPTTAGTGSECQSYALIADETTHQKMACGDPKAAPVERPADAPFNPEMVKIEGMQADPALMGEFANSAKELGLGHAGAEKLLQLHAKAQRQADATMEQQSQTWQQETLAALPQHDIQLLTGAGPRSEPDRSSASGMA